MFTLRDPGHTTAPALTSLDDDQPSFDQADIVVDDSVRRHLTLELDTADAALVAGKTEVAHRALIRAQEIALDVHLAFLANQPAQADEPVTSAYLHLTDRLVDANRAKDREIIAECRLLVNIGSDLVSGVDRRSTAGSGDLACLLP